MDRSQVTGLVLIFLLLISYFTFFAPDREVEPVKPVTTEEQATTSPDEQLPQTEEKASVFTENDSLRNLYNQEKYGDFAAGAQGEQKQVSLENDKIKVTLSTKGGRITEVLLKEFTTWDNRPLILLNEKSSKQDLILPTNKGEINLSELYFTTSASKVSVENEETKNVSFALNLGNGRTIKQVYSLAAGSYQIDYQLNMSGLQNSLSGNMLTYNWHNNLIRQERDLEGQHGSRNKANINYYTVEGDFDDVGRNSVDPESESPEQELKWVSFKQKFFTSALIARETVLKNAQFTTKVDETDTVNIKNSNINLSIPLADLQSGRGKFTYFFGPNDFNVLKKVADDFDENLYLGWGVFSWINRWVIIPVFDVLEGFISNYGIIIILLVIFIKLILFPLSYKSFVSMAKTRVLKPQMDEIKAKYPDDMTKQQSAIMELNQKVGVNPLSGCVPVILQIPILFAMFNFFPNSIELRGEPFLWAADLSTYDSILNLPFTIPFYGDHVSLFTLLMTASTILYTYTNSQVSGGLQAGPMKNLPYIMPVVFMFVLNSFPAGLSFYYFVANIINFLQQVIIRRFVDDEKIKDMLAKSQQRRKEKGKGGTSSFQQRLQAAMKAAEEQKKNKNK